MLELSAMFAEFRDRYPQGSFVADLLQVQDGQYIVRAAIEIDGVILATGMAAAESIEVAEDRARVRAFAGLDVASSSVSMSPLVEPTQKQSSLAADSPSSNLHERLEPLPHPPRDIAVSTVGAFADKTAKSSNTQSKQGEAVGLETASQVDEFPEESPLFFETDEDNPSDERDEDQDFSQSTTIPSLDESLQRLPEKTHPKSASATPSAKRPSSAKRASNELGPQVQDPQIPKDLQTDDTPPQVPIDFSDAIAKTSVELKRLGWSEEQGRKYLWETFGKRSRQRLNDEELLAFLQYLESLPSSITSQVT